MVQGLNLDYFRGLDKYLAPQEENRFLSGKTVGEDGAPNLSKPITSIKKLGTTFVAERTAFGQDVLKGVISNIRKGSSTLQLAGFTTHDLSATGKSKREAIKEALRASEVTWEGLEFAPNQEGGVAGLSGFDFRSGQFNDQRRETDKRNIREAIRFAAEIGAGGGVDLWSREFTRPITGNFNEFVDFEGADPNKDTVYTLVDERTGRAIHQFQTGQLGGQGMEKISVPLWRRATENYVDSNGVAVKKGDYLDVGGNKLSTDPNDPNFIMNRSPEWDSEKKEFKSVQMAWSEFKEYASSLNKDFGLNLAPEEWVGRLQLEQQFAQLRANAIYHEDHYQQLAEALNEAQDAKKNESKLRQEIQKVSQEANRFRELENKYRSGNELSELEREELQNLYSRQPEWEQTLKVNDARLRSIDQIEDYKFKLQHLQETSGRADAQAKLAWENINHIKKMEDYGKQKAFQSYGELGIEALKQTQAHNVANPIYVGPELGWPEGYGGHTDEFIEIIQNSRQEMINQMKQDPHLRSKYKDSEMQELAKKHIQGVLDTSHLSMWYNHFPKQGNESEEERLKRFNGWYLKQMDKLAEADVVGSVQIVDSATGDHQHLPVGEGIFPTVEAVKRLQKKGFKGPIISEGHIYEDTDPGSTQFSLWNEFGGSIGSRGGHFSTFKGGNPFGNVYSGRGAAGYRAPPNYIIGAYNPSNDWQLWSGTPLE